jgi:sigma-B regulation protein RsbU (phosphoserine phosphatase)
MLVEYYILIGLSVLALMIWAWGARYRKNAKRLEREKKEIVGEEERMFDFLHELGEAIEKDSSQLRVNRMIVDGVVSVVNATGGAIYFSNETRQNLVPKYISDKCPQLIGVPLEVKRRAQKDQRVMDSHVRLSTQSSDEGILGHCLTVGKAVHVSDIKTHESLRDAFVVYDDNVSAMVAPLRHAGKDLGVLAVAKPHSDGFFNEHDFSVFRSVAEQSSFALGNSLIHLEASEKRSLENELRTAREVQRILLPDCDPKVAGYRISGTNTPARIISGDYYDFIDLGQNRWGLVIADVSGKGVAAGLLMAMCRSVLRCLAHNESSPAAVLGKLNRQLFPDIREDMFISMAYLILDGDSGKAVMARAGHDPAFWFHKATGEITQIKPPGLVVGIDEGDVFERVTKDYEFTIEPGDCLLLHTDGVKEALNQEEDEFGIERMKENFANNSAKGAESVLTEMLRTLKDFTGEGPQMDDITLVAIEKR